MLNNIFILVVALFLVVRGATMATRHAALLAESFRLSKYVVGFIIVAVISILPETFVSVNAAIEGVPSFGLGTLFGSNVADLTLVVALIILLSKRGLKVESTILKNRTVFPFLLLLPLILGLDGYYSRLEGAALIVLGSVFYYLALKNGIDGKLPASDISRTKHSLLLLFSMAVLLVGAHFTVTSATEIAHIIRIDPILIAMLVVGLGTTMPEFFFSLKAAKKHEDSLAVGDILGTVLADATIVVGILALISPFDFPKRIIYVTGMFMVMAAFVLFKFMRSGRVISKKEAYSLIVFWAAFVLVEIIVNT
jgi:cation:H+ antiporter